MACHCSPRYVPPPVVQITLPADATPEQVAGALDQISRFFEDDNDAELAESILRKLLNSHGYVSRDCDWLIVDTAIDMSEAEEAYFGRLDDEERP